MTEKKKPFQVPDLRRRRAWELSRDGGKTWELCTQQDVRRACGWAATAKAVSGEITGVLYPKDVQAGKPSGDRRIFRRRGGLD